MGHFGPGDSGIWSLALSLAAIIVAAGIGLYIHCCYRTKYWVNCGGVSPLKWKKCDCTRSDATNSGLAKLAQSNDDSEVMAPDCCCCACNIGPPGASKFSLSALVDRAVSAIFSVDMAKLQSDKKNDALNTVLSTHVDTVTSSTSSAVPLDTTAASNEGTPEVTDKAKKTDSETDAEKSLKKSSETLFKIIQTVKVVCVFLLIITPATMLDYRCTVPAQLMETLDDGVTPSIINVPCDKGTMGKNVYNDFLNVSELESSPEFPALDDLRILSCSFTPNAYLGLVLFFECLFLIATLAMGPEIFLNVRLFPLMLLVSGCLWGAWPFLLSYKYAWDNSEYICFVPYAAFSTAVFSVWHSFGAAMAMLTGRVSEEVLWVATKNTLRQHPALFRPANGIGAGKARAEETPSSVASKSSSGGGKQSGVTDDASFRPSHSGKNLMSISLSREAVNATLSLPGTASSDNAEAKARKSGEEVFDGF